jgi:hypothetical protein
MARPNNLKPNSWKQLQQLSKLPLVLLLVTLFLAPQAQIWQHTIAHQDDAHCTSKEKHFHSKEHHCQICDFVFVDIASPSQNIWVLKEKTEAISQPSTYYTSVFCSQTIFTHGLRGPPADC